MVDVGDDGEVTDVFLIKWHTSEKDYKRKRRVVVANYDYFSLGKVVRGFKPLASEDNHCFFLLRTFQQFGQPLPAEVLDETEVVQ